MLFTSRPGACVGLVVLAVCLAPFPEALGPMGVGLARAQEPFEPDPDQIPPDEGGEMVDEGGEMIEGDEPGDFNPAPRPRTPRKAQRGRTKAAPKRKGATPKSKAGAPAGTETGAKTAPGEISFAKQVAPILVANCAGCHKAGRPGLDRGGLDLTTYERMMRGATNGELAVVAGKPDESHMILRVKGEETPRMPQGNDVSLSDEAIGRIERWIKAGAKLDSGLDPKAEIASYAASPEEMERDRLAQMDPEAREGAVEAAGRERWSKTNPELKPEVVPSEHFVIFGAMPKDRATATLKTMEAVLGQLKRAVSPDAAPWVEKISFYVFPDRKDYVEFIRTYKRRDAAPEESGDADLRTQHPYVVIVDPGAEEPEAAAPRRRGRGSADASGPQARRAAAGLLTENLIRAAVLAYGKSPAWLAEGLALYLAQQAERGGAYYQRLRAMAFDAFRQGWATKATETLGGGREMAGDEFRAISFAMVECLASPQYQRLFPAMAKGMSEGQEKLDDVIKDVYGVSRDVFLNVTGEWVAGAYGGVQ